MNKKLILLSCSISLPFIGGSEMLQAKPDNTKPNILCIVAEDISPYLGCYGDPVAVSPNLDSFAEESIRFNRMYTTMGVSSPSRASLITGMYASTIGANNMRTAQNKSKPPGITPYEVVLPEGIKAYTEYMREAGYYCTNNAKTDYQFESPLTAWDENGLTAHWKNAPEDQPFFAIFNLNVSHEFQVMDRSHLPLSVNPADIILPPYFPDDPVVRKDMAVMYSNITEMDKQFQKLLDELKSSERFDNTIIIWYSDNGGPLPRQKREIYESGTLVPFMVRFPDGYKAGTTNDDLLMFVDIPATILSLSGVKVPDYMHGRTFLGKQKAEKREYIYGARNRVDTFYDKQASVRDERFRLIRNFMPENPAYMPIISRARMPMIQRMVELYEAGSLNEVQSLWFQAPRPVFELYDVAEDPHEVNNLANNPAYAEKLAELNHELNSWLEQYNPDWDMSEEEWIERFWPGRVQPQVEQPQVEIKRGKASLTCTTPGAFIAYQIDGKGLNENHWFLYSKPFKVDRNAKITTIGDRAGYKNSSVQAEAYELLLEWVETLLAYQISHADSSLDGGILCPACARIHGRIGDAVLPLMYAAEKTANQKYVRAAKRLMKWMDNVYQEDGAWMNDVTVSDWNGTTVFAAIALYEALHHYGHLVDDSTKTVWEEKLHRAGDFIMENDFIYSRRREGMRNMNVNYSASATYALYAIGKKFAREEFMERARLIASDLHPYFTENNYFLYGEGPEIWNKTKNGCFPVDLLYNVEESLPNLMSYALMANDKEMQDLVIKSMETHLEFMLPDGAWDNSWGTRSFKWTYWGGRTSDGFMGGYAMPDAERNPEFYEAIRRNISLLKKATHNGLLHGGMHYHENNKPPCIHHTFGHAKALASFLSLPVQTPARVSLPRDKSYGVKYMKDINSWLIAKESWRATLTAFDAEYKVKGTHPMGGVLSMLWHEKTGPLLASGMNTYTLIEAPNMQADYQSDPVSSSPHLRLVENGRMFSNLDDLDSEVTHVQTDEGELFTVKTHLVDLNQQYPSFGKEAVQIEYLFTDSSVKVSCRLPANLRKENIEFILPLISAPDEEFTKLNSKTLELKKDTVSVHINSKTELNNLAGSELRKFNYVPGFSFIPLATKCDNNDVIDVELSIR